MDDQIPEAAAEPLDEELTVFDEPLLIPKRRGRPKMSSPERAIAKQASRDKMNAARRANTKAKAEARDTVKLASRVEDMTIKKEEEDIEFQKRIDAEIAKRDAAKAAKEQELADALIYKEEQVAAKKAAAEEKAENKRIAAEHKRMAAYIKKLGKENDAAPILKEKPVEPPKPKPKPRLYL